MPALVERRNFSAVFSRWRPRLLDCLSTYRLRASGRTLLLCGARHQPAAFLDRAEFREHVGRDNIHPHVQAAVARAREVCAARANEHSAKAKMSTTS